MEHVEMNCLRILTRTGKWKLVFPSVGWGSCGCLTVRCSTLGPLGGMRWLMESIVLCPLFFHPSKEVELITRFLPMLMSFVVDDQMYNVDQKLPSEEKGPTPYPSTIPEAFTKYVTCLTDFVLLHRVLLPKQSSKEPANRQGKILCVVKWRLPWGKI